MENELSHQVTAQEARTQLSDLINRAVYARQPSLITRQGKPAAVLVSYEEWRQMKDRESPAKEIGSIDTVGDKPTGDVTPSGGAID